MTVLKIETKNLLTLIKKCLPLMLFSFVFPYINFIVRYFVQMIYGTEILGFYSAIAIFQAVMSMLTSCVWIIYIPLFSELYHQGNAKQIRIIISKILAGILVISAAAVAMAVFFGDPFLVLIYGKEILPYSYLLLPILVISLIVSVVMLFNTILISIGKNNIMLYANISGAVIITACAYPLILKHGLNGANSAMMAGVIVQTILVVLITLRAIHNPDRGLSNQGKGVSI